jgi:hypothetical protein
MCNRGSVCCGTLRFEMPADTLRISIGALLAIARPHLEVWHLDPSLADVTGAIHKLL